MKERYTEIRFCYFIKTLFSKFRNSLYVLDIIDAYCNLGNIDSIVLKQLIRDIRLNQGPVCTYTEEVVYVARQLGISYRDLAKKMKISVSVQSRCNKVFKEHPEQYRYIEQRTDAEQYAAIERFMLIVDIMKEI